MKCAVTPVTPRDVLGYIVGDDERARGDHMHQGVTVGHGGHAPVKRSWTGAPAPRGASP